jgi:hypothetical protein
MPEPKFWFVALKVGTLIELATENLTVMLHLTKAGY